MTIKAHENKLVKYCACGCGKKPPIATRNRIELGHIKGEQVDFCPGHNRRRIPKDITERECLACHKIKPIDQFYRTGKTTSPGSYCKKCSAKRIKEWADRNRDHVNRKGRESAKRRRLAILKEVINHLGDKCVECGEDRWQALEIHHVDNDGAEHRKKYGGTTIAYLKSMLSGKYRLELLCGTCHNIKTRSG